MKRISLRRRIEELSSVQPDPTGRDREMAATGWVVSHLTEDETQELAKLISSNYRGPLTEEKRLELVHALCKKAEERADRHRDLNPDEHAKWIDFYIEGERIRHLNRLLTGEEKDRLMEINRYQDQHRHFDLETGTLGPWKIYPTVEPEKEQAERKRPECPEA